MDEVGELETLLASGTARSMLDAIMACIPACSVLVRKPDGKILRVSDYAADLFALRREEWEGRTYAELVAALPPHAPDGTPLPLESLPVMRALQGETVSGFEGSATFAGGRAAVLQAGAAPIHNASGEVIGAISALTDMSVHKALEAELRAAAERKEALYRELTHRVKNHLNLVSAMVTLETRDPGLTAQALAERIRGSMQTLAAVYDSMTGAETAGAVEARGFIENVVRPYPTPGVQVAVEAPADLTLTPDQAGPIGMLVNEAVCNAVKHAFPGGVGRVEVALRRAGPERLRLEVADDGPGFGGAPPDKGSHGVGLMRLQARQLHGAFEIGDRPGGGAMVSVDLPAG